MPIDPDPLPTSLIHACALRRPIVAAATGGIPEIVEDGVGGLLVPSRDANAVAGALLNLLGDPQRRAAFGEQAHEHFVRRFSHEQMVTGLADAYRQCLATKAK